MNSKTIHITAPAKVNIALDIVGKRADGYHEMRMINHSLSLADELTFTDSASLTLSCNDSRVPLNEKNIVYRTARELMAYSGERHGAHIHIEKRIPMEAGLAGGSADAAATLKGLNQLWQLDLSADELDKIAVKCGADVPYCLHGGTALVEGIGEIITPLPDFPVCDVLVVKPPIDISTPWAFVVADQCQKLIHPEIDRAVACIRAKDPDAACAYFGNSFESAIFSIYPEIDEVKQKLKKNGAFYVTMTGSGSTVIGYFRDEASTLNAKEAFEGKMFACATKLLA